jgi:hypothetical protein
VAGATRIVATDNTPLIVSRGADHILLSGIIFDGSGRNLPANAGLIQLAAGRAVAIRDCEIIGSGRNGIMLEDIEGEIVNTIVNGALGAAIHALDSRALGDRAQHDPQQREQRHPGVALAGGRRRHPGDRQPQSRTRWRWPAARGRTATPSTCSAPTM